MATLLKCGGLFLHVPKTGGNWVRDMLEANDLVFAHLGGKHAGPVQLAPLRRLLQTPDRYDRPNRPLFTFCFVRHPLGWYESWFRMNVALGWPDWATDADAWNPSCALNGFAAPTFDGFIEHVLRRRPGFLSSMYASYARGALVVGRQESMAEDLGTVLRFLRAPFDERSLRSRPRTNVSAPVDVRLDPALRAALEAAESDAYERYGYATDVERTLLPAPAAMHLSAGGPTRLTGPFVHDGGHAWRVPLAQWADVADDMHHARRSMLQLTENGVPLTAAHASHADIRVGGRGRYSHWAGIVRFSTSDNSDPNHNGRRYDVSWVYPAADDTTSLMAGDTVLPIGACA